MQRATTNHYRITLGNVYGSMVFNFGNKSAINEAREFGSQLGARPDTKSFAPATVTSQLQTSATRALARLAGNRQ